MLNLYEKRIRCVICGRFMSDYDPSDICDKCIPIAEKEAELQSN